MNKRIKVACSSSSVMIGGESGTGKNFLLKQFIKIV
ncbi:MAG: hypothetical protein ACOCWE_04155 [Bacillota bacterium]